MTQQVQPELEKRDEFIISLKIAPFDEQAALVHGEIRAYPEKRGTPMGVVFSRESRDIVGFVIFSMDSCPHDEAF